MKQVILYIWLQQALGFYSRLPSEIFSRFESIEAIYKCEDFSFLGEKRARYIKRLESKDTSAAFEVMKRCETMGVRVTGFLDELYPERLRMIESPPVVLYSIGNFRDLNKTPCISVVGTRKMSDYGKNISEQFAYAFAKSGAYVISGLAKGIDTAAHRGATMADGYTVGVLGNPIGDIYPRENIKAFETLYKRGLVISELYPGAPRTKADFPNRNRIISGISDAVVIVEAGEKSGALITARHAISQGRKLYAVPGAVGADNAGANSLIKSGVATATEPLDVLSPLALVYPEKLWPYEPAVTKGLMSYGNTGNISKQNTPGPKFTKPDISGLSRTDDGRHEDNVGEITADRAEKKNAVPNTDAAEPRPSPDASINAAENPDLISKRNKEKISKALGCMKALTVDEISAKSALDVVTVMVELTMMEIEGSVIACAGGRFISSTF